MSADIYYAESKQNAIGVIEKSWVYDRTIKCSIISAMSDKTLTGELKSNNSLVQFTSNMLLRTNDNVQSKKNGTFYPITEILITNIKDSNGKVVTKDVKDKNVQYEIKTFVASYGDTHEIKFYRGYIERSPKQNEVTY
jgi:hypothetical protein